MLTALKRLRSAGPRPNPLRALAATNYSRSPARPSLHRVEHRFVAFHTSLILKIQTLRPLRSALARRLLATTTVALAMSAPKLYVKKLSETAVLPKKGSALAAGWDLVARPRGRPPASQTRRGRMYADFSNAGRRQGRRRPRARPRRRAHGPRHGDAAGLLRARGAARASFDGCFDGSRGRAPDQGGTEGNSLVARKNSLDLPSAGRGAAAAADVDIPTGPEAAEGATRRWRSLRDEAARRESGPAGSSSEQPSPRRAGIAPRSGLAVKKFIDTGAGVVDADYRGAVGVVLFNHGAF